MCLNEPAFQLASDVFYEAFPFRDFGEKEFEAVDEDWGGLGMIGDDWGWFGDGLFLRCCNYLWYVGMCSGCFGTLSWDMFLGFFLLLFFLILREIPRIV